MTHVDLSTELRLDLGESVLDGLLVRNVTSVADSVDLSGLGFTVSD